MKFLAQPLWTTIHRELAAARKIRVTTYNLNLNTLITLANQAPHAEIHVIFNRDTRTPWNDEEWRDFKDRFGGRVKIRRQTTSPDLHAKVLRVAGECEFAIVGSSNLSKPGYGIDGDGRGNQEASIRVEDPSEIRAIDQWWKKLWSNTGDYVHLSDDTNPDIQPEAQASRTVEKKEEEEDNDPDETLQTAPDDLKSLKRRIQLAPPTHDNQLRPYQREILSALDERWDERSQEGPFRELVVLPVGAGKTCIAAEFIRRRLAEKAAPFRILWVAHTLELAEQAISSVLSQLSNLKVSFRTIVWIGNAKSMDVLQDLNKNESVIAFATVQSKLREKLPHGTKQFDLVVVDEAHHYGNGNTWRKQIEEVWKIKQLLGLTATPERLDGENLPFDVKHGDDITFRSLVEQGILACPKYESVKTTGQIKGLRPFSKKFFAYFESQGIKQFDQDDRNRFIAKDLAQRTDLGPTLVFCATKAHADRLAEALKHEGVSPDQTRSIHSDSLEDRGETLQWFGAGGMKRRILLNCKLYIEGFDMPDIRTIVLARPTLSPTYWVQMIGRGVRKIDDHDRFTIIEYTDDYEDPKWDAHRASFYLLHDKGLDKWRELQDNVSSADGQQITDWNLETQQIYKRILRKFARHSKAA
ncbi:MAG: DEAD/DEAH box helicase family protein [Nitrospira sp.]|nr:DEAD/DEAH box helicase family protein [Nitrospira sp.]